MLVSPEPSESTVMINQDAWFSIADIDGGKEIVFTKERKENGVYFFVLKGGIAIDNFQLQKRDGLGLENEEIHRIAAKESAQLLAIEVPMTQEH